jgi:site-specific recombinase XerD
MKQKVSSSVRFVLKNPTAKSKSAINMIFAWGYRNPKGQYQPLKYSTGQSVNPNNWNVDKQIAKGAYADNINNAVFSVKIEAQDIFLKLKDEGLTPDILKQELDIRLGRIEPTPVPKKKKVYVVDYVTRYIEEMETGERRSFKDPVKMMAPGTIRNIKAFKNKFLDYEDSCGKQFVFSDIDMKFYRHFIAWLDSMHTVNSSGKTIKQLKTIMQAALEDNIHSNIEFKKKTFKVVSELVDTIYLNDDEIKKLYKFKGKANLEKARDLFLVGCFTAQRVSDWHKVNKSNIMSSAKGTEIIKLQQQKTGATVVIPLVDPWLIAILEKYNYELPKMPDQKINEYIKEVCKAVKINEKAKQVTTHTARRSACTNMYNAGIPIKNIMKVSGHKTESEFRKYIRVTDEENAENLSIHPYYTRKHI